MPGLTPPSGTHVANQFADQLLLTCFRNRKWNTGDTKAQLTTRDEPGPFLLTSSKHNTQRSILILFSYGLGTKILVSPNQAMYQTQRNNLDLGTIVTVPTK